MFELPISQQQSLSHAYLQQLVNNPNFCEFVITQDRLITPAKVVAGQTSLQSVKPTQLDFRQAKNAKKLLIFTEALCLGQLAEVAEALAAQLSLQFFRIIKVDGVQGFAVCAYLLEPQQATTVAQLALLAEQHCLELCLVDNPPKLTQPGLLLMDMDSTVIAVECIDEIAALAGVGEQVAEVTEQAMQGKLDFVQSLRTRVACLTGADQKILKQVQQALPLMPGVANLVQILKRHNWKVAIASGGFSYFADYLQQRLGLDSALANDLAIQDGQLTGQLEGAIIDAKAKANNLLALAKKWQIPQQQTIAMGDGANDLLMMNAAALGVALHAKPVVQEQADISIRRADLDVLLWVLSV